MIFFFEDSILFLSCKELLESTKLLDHLYQFAQSCSSKLNLVHILILVLATPNEFIQSYLQLYGHNEQWHIVITGPFRITTRNKQYILVIKDRLT